MIQKQGILKVNYGSNNMKLKDFLENKRDSFNFQRSFSLMWNRNEFIKHISSYSKEFIHNCVRLLIRPTNKSADHWFDKALTWFSDTLTQYISYKRRPVFALFDELLGKNPTKKDPNWYYPRFTYWIEKVRRESTYGYVPQLSDDEIYNYFLVLVNLYLSTDTMKKYSTKKARKLLIDMNL